MSAPSYSTSPPNTNIDALDSHWAYVTARIAVLNPARLFGQVVEAANWPFHQAVDSAFYMSIGNRGKPSATVNSWQGPLYTYSVRWCWQIQGANLTQAEQAANRGSRYRVDLPMQTELLNGLFPGFCQKQMYSVAQGPSGSQFVATPYGIYESVWWSKPDFGQKVDANTGILFGFAAVAVSSFAPEINS